MKNKTQNLIYALAALSEATDHEQAHSDADELLLEYIGDEDVRKAYEKIERWYA